MVKYSLRILWCSQHKIFIIIHERLNCKVKLRSVSTDRMTGRNIELGVDKPKNLSFNDIKCDKNNRPFDNSTNGISCGLSCDSSYDLFLDFSHDIMIQTWNRHIRSFSDWLNGYMIEMIHDTVNDSTNDE